MKTKLLLVILMLTLLCGGCDILKKKPITNKPDFNIQEDIKNAKNTINTSTKTIEKASKNITTEANKINKETIEVQRIVPEDKKAEIYPHLNIIKESSNNISKDATKIDKATSELSGAQSLLDNAEQKVSATENILDKMTKERDSALESKRKAEADRDSQMQKMLKWLIIACIVGAGICVVAFFMFGNKAGLIGAGACILVLTLASFVQTYFIYLAIIGGFLLLLLLAGLIWNIIVQKKAFSQIVETVEVAKDNLSEEAKNKIFGAEGEQGIMRKVQNKKTVALVHKEKDRLGSLWNYAKNKKE